MTASSGGISDANQKLIDNLKSVKKLNVEESIKSLFLNKKGEYSYM